MVLSENHSALSSSGNAITDQYQSNIRFKKNSVKRIIQRLDLDKAHDGYMINIGMVKIFRNAIIETIFTVSEICSKFRTFSGDWKQ